MARDTVIEAVGEVVATTPGGGLPAVDDRRGVLSRAFRRARGVLVRQPVAEPVDVDADVLQLPSTERRFSPLLLSFLAFVLLPALAGTIYFAFVASDQYVAEMRFVVRFGQQDTGTSAGGGGGIAQAAQSAMSGGGSSGRPSPGGSSTEDAYIVSSYVRSRGIVDDLSRRMDLRAIFTRPEADIISRLKHNASVDELYEYWLKMVTTNVESSSGIVKVNVAAFRQEDALAIASRIEELAETLVNTISTRARQDSLRRAGEELQRAQNMMFAALADMERYRNAEGLIDPVQTATDTGKILTSLLGEQLAVENQLFVARQSLSPESPSVRNLQTRIDSLRRQVTDLRQQLAGKGAETRNVASAIARFEEVSIKQKIAESLYMLAANGLDRARRSAEAQSIYLTTFVPPRLPEDYKYPLRVFNSFAIAALAFIFWSITCLIIASVEDHRLN